MRAHLVQLDIAWEDKPANRERVRTLTEQAGIAADDLIVLPEMFETGFSIDLDRAPDRDGSGAAFLRELAQCHSAYVIGGLAVDAGAPTDRPGRNRALIFDPAGEPLGAYDKVHPFGFGREGERFTGGVGPICFDWASGENHIRVCPLICYDLRFPELFRAALDLGTEAFVVIANWPRPRRQHWRTLLEARAIENQAVVIGVNRAGADPYLKYAGGSGVWGPRGELLALAEDREAVLAADCPIEHVRRWRSEFPALSDRRYSVRKQGESEPTLR